jgi:hypothetical protein
MSLAYQTPNPISRQNLRRTDRRGWRRVPLALPVRLMDSDGVEIDTTTVDVCGGGLKIERAKPLRLNERVIVYSAELGRLETEVVRADPDGIALRLIASAHKREKLVDQLTWLINRDRYDLHEERRAERLPGTGSIAAELEDGSVIPCLVIDMSLVGIALATDGVKPPLGARVKIGAYWGRCARYLPNGFALDFTRS